MGINNFEDLIKKEGVFASIKTTNLLLLEILKEVRKDG